MKNLSKQSKQIRRKGLRNQPHHESIVLLGNGLPAEGSPGVAAVWSRRRQRTPWRQVGEIYVHPGVARCVQANRALIGGRSGRCRKKISYRVRIGSGLFEFRFG